MSQHTTCRRLVLVLDEEVREERTCRGNSQITPSDDRVGTILGQACKGNGSQLLELNKNYGKESECSNSKGEEYINYDAITHYLSRSSACG